MNIAGTTTSRGGVLAMVACALTGRACDSPAHVTSPTLARASSGVLAAWEQIDGDGATTYVRRFPALTAGTTTVRDGTAVHRVRYGTSWYSPEVVSGPAGSLVIVSPRAGEQIAIPLDGEGAPSGPAQPLTACQRDAAGFSCFDLCRRPVATRDGFAIGHAVVEPRSGVTGISVSFLDSAGKTLRTDYLPSFSPSRRCAIAALEDDVAVAYGDMTSDRSVGVRIHFLSGSERWIPTPGGAHVRALIAADDHLFLLCADETGPYVARLDRDGVRDRIGLPPSIDLETADLGLSDAGVFVTWLAKGKLQLQLVRERPSSHRRHRAGRAVSGTRALGVGKNCIAAWSSSGGAKLHLLNERGCS